MKNNWATTHRAGCEPANATGVALACPGLSPYSQCFVTLIKSLQCVAKLNIVLRSEVLWEKP